MGAWRCWRALGLLLACAAGCYPSPEYDLDRLGVPRFVSANYIDLSGATRISLFRSSAGHDYADEAESCRSMKHYFGFPDDTVAVYTPVTGHVLVVDGGWAGVGITIQSLEFPAFQFTIFHVVLAEPMPTGTRVEAGTYLGRHVGTQTASDIAVEVNTPSGRRLVSYFETLTDEAFAPFQVRGIAGRADLIITRAERDAAPLSCDGETFVNSSSDPYPQWVSF